MTDVRVLLDQLAAGKVTVGAVAADFATRKWVADTPPAQTYEEAVAVELNGFGPLVRNSWAEVESAHSAGRLSDDQYGVLFSAYTGQGDGPPFAP